MKEALSNFDLFLTSIQFETKLDREHFPSAMPKLKHC